MAGTIEFVYSSVGPGPWQDKKVNLVKLQKSDEGSVTGSRHWINTDGSHADGIAFNFDGLDARGIARAIHWGCTGTDDDGVMLRGKIAAFLSEVAS